MSVVPRRGRLNPRPLLMSLAIGFAGSVSVPITAGTPSAVPAPSATQAAPFHIDQALAGRLSGGGKSDMFVYLGRRADLSAAFGMDWNARGHYVQQALQAVAEESQRELRALLDQQGVQYQAFWIDNVIHVRDADLAVLDTLASRAASAGIDRIIGEPDVRLIEPEKTEPVLLPELAAAISNIEHVNAPDVWNLGFTGRGITVANIDTGARYSHDALVHRYRGTIGPDQYDHNYNWWSPYDHSAAPTDPHNHGSHTIGTMVGDGGSDRLIGMAPGAKWMACQGFNPSSTASALFECGQFMLAPWNLAQQNPDPNRRPHVVNNSWTDCNRQVDTWYEGVVDAWIAAGIVPVFSNGNASNCNYSRPPGLNTVGNPARYGKVLSVGSTGTDNGLYAAHSNWGPTDYPTAGLPNYPDHQGFPSIKPNIVAPGVSVLSAGKDSDDHYYLSNGTSMSAPHVAGLVALMWEAAPCLVGDYAGTGTIIMKTARPVPYASGGTPAPGPGNVPNYATGWGEIDALAAVDAAMEECGGFTIAGAPAELHVCAANPASYALELRSHGGFHDPVTLSIASGLPAGVTASFSQNPLVPADPASTSTLGLGNTAGQPSASYRLTVKAQSSGPAFAALERSVDLDLHIDAAALAAPTLSAPANGETNVVVRPNFEWNGVAGETYHVQVATDAAFAAPSIDQTVAATSFRPTSLLATGKTYYWRVRGENTCGGGNWSATGTFSTRFDPVASITPGSLAFTLAADATDSRSLNIANTGSAELVWTAAEAGVSATAPSADAAWQPIGPLGGDVEAIAISPINPDLILLGTAPAVGAGNLYRSIDGGASWTQVISGANIYSIVYAGDGTAYAGTMAGVRKSTDDGVTWSTPNLNIGANRQTFGVAVAPSNSSIVWAAVAAANGVQTKNLLRSTDAGVTWQNVTPTLGATLNGRAIAVHPTNPNTVVALFDGGFGGGQVWVSTNGGASWTNRSAGLPGNPPRSVHFDGTRLLVGGGQAYNNQYFGLYQSLDLGVTWAALHTSTPTPHVEAIAVDPQDSDTIYLATSNSGIHRSRDGGVTWQTGLGGTSRVGMMDLALVPGSPGEILAGAMSQGLFRSLDGGDSFAAYGTGIAEARLYSVTTNPLNPQEIAVAFQAANAGGIYSTADGGAHWIVESAPPTRYVTVRFAPDGTLYGISTGPTTIAREAVYRRETDGTWTHLGPNQGANFLVDLEAIAFGWNDPNLIVVGGKDNGVAGSEATIWRSTDRGQTWTKVHEATAGYKVTAIEIIQDGTDLNMVATAGSASLGGVLRSTDGGASWQPSSAGIEPVGYWATARMCTHPATPQRVFAVKGNPSALYRSDDGGANWQATGSTFPVLVVSLACDPVDENVIYAGQSSTLAGTIRVLRSGDAGASFERFDSGIPVAGPVPQGFAFKGTSSLLAATNGGGTFETSLGGEARACMSPHDVPWLTLGSTGGTVAPGAGSVVTVGADANSLALGQYRAQLCFSTNDPNAELIRVPVQLTVADSSAGTLAGNVSALGYCGRQTTAAANAQVTITGQHNSFTMTTDSAGRFSREISLDESPLSVLVRKAGHVDVSLDDIVLASTQTTTVDLQVKLDAPCLETAPSAFDVALEAGGNTTQTFTLHNTDGAGTLDWNARGATPTASPAPEVLAPAGGSGAGGFELAGHFGQPLPGLATIGTAGQLDCNNAPGLIRHDDGSVESGYGADPSLVQRITMVDYFVPRTYPTMLDAACIVFVSIGPSSLDFDLVVYDDDGPGGSPGTELGSLALSATDLPIPPLPPALPWKSFDLSSLNLRIFSGGVYIGVRWFATDPPVTLGADTSAGQPANVGHGYKKFDQGAWESLVAAWPAYRSLFIRAATHDVSGCEAASSVSWLTLTPSSGSVAPGASTDVAVRIDSSGLATGEHHASLCLDSNDPEQPRVIVPVRLTVEAGANDPATLSALGGSGQSAALNAAFPVPLSVQVLNSQGQPLAGANVDFTAPATGASTALSQARVTTDANGYAAVQAVANASAGTYAVTASVSGVTPAQFVLTNLAASTDLAIEVRSLRGYAQRGDLLDYLVTVRNLGRDAVANGTVSGQLSPQLDATFASWQCLAADSSHCTGSGTGDLQDASLAVPAGSSLSYLVSAPVRWNADGLAALAGRTTHAADANPANDQHTAGAPIVIYRDGFEHFGQTAGLQPGQERLDMQAAIAFTPDAPARELVDTVLVAMPEGTSDALEAAAFRIERLNGAGTTWLRIVARDESGQAFATDWTRANPAGEAVLALVELEPGSEEGEARRQYVLNLGIGSDVLTVPLADPAGSYVLWSFTPVRRVAEAN
ncbi:S8 family serine peptidase [Dokdonella koreensis]|uniref:Peptidase S8 and S53 subtilisin kexin sedolisin n=1 Tax=Dokdonella koreensis DS-123 TaxID=1300342 RepID=A0A167H2T6_9GAMM|nr:S8 family serine peptidase [Dokdonella koreensis]ANB18646.1 Peptidase S8 and S53 subtilisin kexin sedolisin [Dokdonella koreensis DS-123]